MLNNTVARMQLSLQKLEARPSATPVSHPPQSTRKNSRYKKGRDMLILSSPQLREMIHAFSWADKITRRRSSDPSWPETATAPTPGRNRGGALAQHPYPFNKWATVLMKKNHSLLISSVFRCRPQSRTAKKNSRIGSPYFNKGLNECRNLMFLTLQSFFQFLIDIFFIFSFETS